MKLIVRILFIFILLAGTVPAQSPVTVDVNINTPKVIPENFLGFSYGRRELNKGTQGALGYFFDSTNTQLITLFRELGIKNIRIGGTPVDTQPSPSHEDVDAFFRFIKALNLRVIFSFRLENGNMTEDASLAKYVWDHYSRYIDYFAVGNEPDIYNNGDPEITDYSSYLTKWRIFTSAILDSVPDAKFGGPDLAGTSWFSNFARDEEGSNFLTSIFGHFYVGGSSSAKNQQQLADEMLSSSWLSSKYPARFNIMSSAATQHGFSYRFTEANSYYGTGPANIYASSLFVVDFLYWWALNGGPKFNGIDIHINMDRLNTTIYRSASGYQVYPLGYGIKAFSLGGYGEIYQTGITNTDGLNITAYASGSSDSLFVTIINKEHGSRERNALVTVSNAELPKYAAVMYLTAPDNDVTSVNGVKLNGASINNYGSFQGRWMLVDTAVTGSCIISVPAASAAIVWFTKQIFETPPDMPELVPTHGYIGVPLKPTLKWNMSNEADFYRLQVSLDADFFKTIIDTIIADTLLRLPSSLSFDTKYYWRVSVLDSAWSSSFSVPDSFTTIYFLPAIPTLVSPPAYETGVLRQTTFIWNVVPHANNYRLLVATDYHIYTEGDSAGVFLKENVVVDTTLSDITIRLSAPLDSLKKYFWEVRSINENGVSNWANSPLFFFTTGTGLTAAYNEQSNLLYKFALYQNYPNPFNPTTIISYDIEKSSHVKIDIYDILGREVASLVNANQSPGKHSVEFNGSNLSSGVYFVRMDAGHYTSDRKILLLK